MRLYFLIILAVFYVVNDYSINKPGRVYATCYGYSPCNACKNCSACKHCNSGGTCGICAPAKKTNPPKTKPQDKKPATRQPSSSQCKAKTQKGNRCSRTVKSGNYCWQHQ